MTRFQEFPLRAVGQPWPGLNTRGGKLDPGSGQLEDGSINAVINEADILEKRSGLVRGLNERFDGVVCGLFRYTDDCGNEYLLVADETSIKIRTPFQLPVNSSSDAYPLDSFENDLSEDLWGNTENYMTSGGSLVLISDLPLALMQWFKDSANLTYFVEIEYEFSGTGSQSVVVVVRRSGSSYVQADVSFDGTNYAATLRLFISGVARVLGTASLGGVALGAGFLRLTYGERSTPAMRATPSGGTPVDVSAQISGVDEAALGLGSAVGITSLSAGIKQVSGGPA